MPRTSLVAALVGIAALLVYAGSDPKRVPPMAADPAAPEYAVSGPFTHDNLPIFLLHGPDTLPPRNVLTLDEALAQGTAVVHETGNVNTL